MAPAGLKARLSNTLRHVLMRRAVIAEVEALGGHFHRITLEGVSLRDVEWTPGQKVQIAMEAPFETRTYTPIGWDAAAGRMRLLGYAHGAGPGSAWLGSVQPGDACDIFGPRESVDPSRISKSVALFGDETSIGLACALAAQSSVRLETCYFEVNDMASATSVIADLRLPGVSLHVRSVDDSHMFALEAAAASLVTTDSELYSRDGSG